MEEYNREPVNRARPSAPKVGKYTRGSIAQRIFEPTLYTEKLENGAVFYDILDCDIGGLQEDKMRRTYDNYKKYSEVALEGETDDDELRKALMDEQKDATVPLDEVAKILGEELGTFKEGEAYSFTKDLRKNMDDSLSKPLAAKIFSTIPAHHFHDIKKPLLKSQLADVEFNRINPLREPAAENFFDQRRNEEWLQNRRNKRDLH